ncbi:MAG: insulinase family protein [Bacteroidetes bacterium]|nr:insulinase family protein [Bacteroidota bacterium]
MKYFAYLISGALVFLCACSPKNAAQKTSTPTPSVKAPSIPIPSGDKFRLNAPKAGAAPVVQVGKAVTRELENGLKIIVVENHKLPKISVQLFADYEPVLEKDAKGYVDLMADLWTKGTKNRTKAQLDEEIDWLGASLNASPSGLSGNCLSKYADKYFSLFADVALNPVFSAEELEKSKKRYLSNLAQGKTDPGFMAQNLASAMRYGKSHPYGEVATETSMQQANLKQIKDHYDKFIKPNVSYLVFVGDIQVGKAEKLAKQYFGAWKKAEVPAETYGIPHPPESNEVDLVNKPGAVQSVVQITYPIELEPGHPDEIRVRLLNTVLGGYFNSRVNSNLRETHGWTYGANTRMVSDKLVGYFTATANVRTNVTDSAIVEFLKEMRRIKTEKVPSKELQMVKNVITGQFSQNLESPETVARFALSAARFHLPDSYFQEYLNTLQSISADEVMLMARKYLKPENAHIVVVGDQKQLADKLSVFSANKKIQLFDAFAQPVKEPVMAVPADMTAEKVIENYLKAIGATRLSEIKDLVADGALQFSGPEIAVRNYQKDGTKIAIEMKLNGQLISKRVFDGVAGNESGMGGATRAIEGKALEDLREQAAFCKEAHYLNGAYKLKIKQIDEIGGVKAYVLECIRPDGQLRLEYYDLVTGLKIQEIGSETNYSDQTVDITTVYSDYKAVNGVLIPFKTMIIGLTPAPMTLQYSSIMANQGVEDKVFKL